MTNILLIAAVVALFILFVTVLMKLNPSTKAEETAEREITIERQRPEPIRTEPSVPQNHAPIKESVPITVEKPAIVLNATVGGPSIQTAHENKRPIFVERREVMAKPEKTLSPAKAEIGGSLKRDCLHQFGYLRTLPKNAPIPDECFGCQKIVECLVQAKTR
jgi:hypothetical protein